jgi:hypothetical protein
MIYFISYPKCGRTWCRTIIDQYAKRSKAEPKDHIWTHIKFGNVKDPKRERDEGWLEEDATNILLKRNDLDALVSMYHDQMVRVTEVKKRYRKRSIDEYVMDKSDHLLEFKKKCREIEYVYEFSYEKMIKDPFNTFLPAMEIVFDEVDIDIFKETLEFCRFDNLYKLERSGDIDMRGSARFQKTRKGKVGSHREELQKETIRKLRKKFRK